MGKDFAPGRKLYDIFHTKVHTKSGQEILRRVRLDGSTCKVHSCVTMTLLAAEHWVNKTFLSLQELKSAGVHCHSERVVTRSGKGYAESVLSGKSEKLLRLDNHSLYCNLGPTLILYSAPWQVLTKLVNWQEVTGIRTWVACWRKAGET